MAKLNCPQCGNLLADDAADCPQCGFSDTKFMRELQEAVHDAHNTTPIPDYKGDERRRHLRIRRRLRMTVNNHPALLLDVSQGGMRFSTDQPPATPRVEILLFTPVRHFKLKGTIRWISRHSSLTRHREAGVEFSEVPGEFLQYLEKITIPADQPDSADA